jgi:hypothetical protein
MVTERFDHDHLGRVLEARGKYMDAKYASEMSKVRKATKRTLARKVKKS